MIQKSMENMTAPVQVIRFWERVSGVHEGERYEGELTRFDVPRERMEKIVAAAMTLAMITANIYRT